MDNNGLKGSGGTYLDISYFSGLMKQLSDFYVVSRAIKVEKEETKMSKFVETVTEKKIKNVTNGYG